MNCFEKLWYHHTKVCEACIYNQKIINFKDLPEELKYEADYYDDEKDLLVFCEKCNWHGIIEGDKEA